MAKTKWVIDPTHSEIGFKVKHMMFTNVSGKFESYEASAESEGNDFKEISFHFSADSKSITTGNSDRDMHLKSGDFFDVEKFPKLEFKSTSVKKLSDDTYELTGDFSMHGTTKPISLALEYGGTGEDPWGNTKAGFTINGKINRKNWGLNWNSALEAGGVLVGEDVKLHAEIQLIKQ